MLDRRRVEQVPLRRPARRVADHAGPAAHQRHRATAEALEPDEPEDRHQVADVRASRRRGRTRCRRRSAGPSRAAPAARASSRAGCPATRAPGAARRARSRRPRRSSRSPGRHRLRAGTVVRPARSARSGVHSSHGIFTADMQTSLRRQRRRRLGDRRRPRGNGATAAKAVAVAIPLILFTVIALLGVAGATASVAAYTYLARDLEDPKEALDDLGFTQQTAVYDRSGKVQLARLGDDRREVVTFADIPPALIDATTSIEDKTFWENSGFDPAGFVAAAIDTIKGRDRGGSTITQQLVRARLLPAERLRGQRLRAQGQGDHPVDPPDRGLPGRDGQADDHREVPQPELLRQPQLRRRRRGPELLAQGPQGADPGPGGAAGRHPPVPHPLRPREERRRGDVQGLKGEEQEQLVVPPTSEIVQRRNFILDLMKTRSVLTSSSGGYEYAASSTRPIPTPTTRPPRPSP